MFDESIAQRGINSEFESFISAASTKYNVPTALIKAIISTESAWNPNAVNINDPSYGLMQLNANYWKNPDGSPIRDPASNIDTGTSYLASLTSRFGPDLSPVISAYNAGQPTTSNQAYVNEVLQYYNWYLQNDSAWGTTGSDLQMIAGVVLGIAFLYLLVRH